MTNLQTNNQTAKPGSQESFNNVVAQLNAAIVSWGCCYDGRGPAMTKAFVASRTILFEAFPQEAAVYNGAVVAVKKCAVDQDVKFPASGDLYSKVNYALLNTNRLNKDLGKTINLHSEQQKREHYRRVIVAAALIVIVLIAATLKIS